MGIKVRNTLSILSTLGGIAAGIVVVIMLFMVATNTALRYLFDTGWFFVEEYTGYGLVFLTFVPLAYTLHNQGHITIDALVDRLPTHAKKRLSVVTSALSLVVVGILLYHAIVLAFGSLERGSRSNTVMLTPTWFPQMFIVVGMLLFVLEIARYLFDIVKDVRND